MAVEYQHQFRLIAALSYLLLPPALCFGAAGTALEHLFRPWPANNFYDAMLLAVCFAVTITEAIGGRARSHDEYSGAAAGAAAAGGEEANALTMFEVLLALLLGVLYCAAQAPAAGACWLAVAAALTSFVIAASVGQTAACEHPAEGQHLTGATSTHGLVTAQQQAKGSSRPLLHWSWQLEQDRTVLEWVFSVFLCLAAVLFLAFPVLQPWSGPPERFVRWHPYSPAGELVWRGVFAAYAAMMFWAGLEDPLRKHLAFTTYLGLSGSLHATVMLIMNLWERAHGRSNGNPEHLYGDVAGWYVISVLSGIVVLLHRFTPWTTKKQL